MDSKSDRWFLVLVLASATIYYFYYYDYVCIWL